MFKDQFGMETHMGDVGRDKDLQWEKDKQE